MYTVKKCWDALDKAKLIGTHLYQGKIVFDSGGNFYGLFLIPKTKYCLTINDCGIVEQHMTFKGLNDRKRLLHRSQFFDMLEGKKITAMLTRSRKLSFFQRD